MGNLVCTAGFDLGEHLRIVVLSTSEGDDKAVKYPAIFQGSDALVITKIDLLPHLNFDVARITADMKRLAPEAAVFQVSAVRGDGISEVAEWLAEKMSGRERAAEFQFAGNSACTLKLPPVAMGGIVQFLVPSPLAP